MTREEAIKWVKFVHDVLYEDKDEDIRTALDMAISALQTEPTLSNMSTPKEPTPIYDYMVGKTEPSDLMSHEEAWKQIESDLISRADAIDAVCGTCLGEHYTKCNQAEWCADVNALKALPSADIEKAVEEKVLNKMLEKGFIELPSADRPSGEWIEVEDDYKNRAWECSNCEEAWKQIESDLISRAEAINVMVDVIEAIEKNDEIEVVDRFAYPTIKDYAEEAFSFTPSVSAVSKEEYDDVKGYMNTLVDAFIEDGNTIADLEERLSAELPKGDLISRADVLKYPIRLDHYDEVNGSRQFVYGVESVIEYVEALPSAVANSDDLIIKNGKGIQDGLYNIKDGEIFKYKAKGGTVRAYKLVPSVSAEREYWRGYNDGHTPYARLGEWIFNGYADENKSWFICSECDHSQFHKSNYCPNCGARMKGADNV